MIFLVRPCGEGLKGTVDRDWDGPNASINVMEKRKNTFATFFNNYLQTNKKLWLHFTFKTLSASHLVHSQPSFLITPFKWNGSHGDGNSLGNSRTWDKFFGARDSDLRPVFERSYPKPLSSDSDTPKKSLLLWTPYHVTRNTASLLVVKFSDNEEISHKDWYGKILKTL